MQGNASRQAAAVFPFRPAGLAAVHPMLRNRQFLHGVIKSPSRGGWTLVIGSGGRGHIPFSASNPDNYAMSVRFLSAQAGMRRHNPTDWSPMRSRQGLALTVIVIAMALTGACAEQKNQEGKAEPGNTALSSPGTTTPAPSWDGKEDQEDAMRRTTLALKAVQPDGASRVVEGMESLARGLKKTFTAQGDRPYTVDVACQAPAHRSVTLTLARGDAHSEWEVTCGDREADQFNIAVGGPFTVRITHAGQDAEGLVLWRLNTVAPQDVDGCEDDIKGCEG
ncbi:hypothetical protein [Streptomyces sp. NPDC054794]